MVYRLGESYVDVLHGIDQRLDRLDIVGKRNPSNLSKGIFLTSYIGYDFSYTVNHTEQKPLYYYAIKLRQFMGKALDSILPPYVKQCF